MSIKRIHINQHKIRSNKKNGTNDPVITVKCGKTNTYGHEVEIQGPSKIVYRPGKPLNCGARVWIESDAPVLVDGQEVEMSPPTACNLLNAALTAKGYTEFVRYTWGVKAMNWLPDLFFEYTQYDDSQSFEKQLLDVGCQKVGSKIDWKGFQVTPVYCDAHCCGF